ncbi:MAG: diguanylate cyclase, partial [Oscillospiraceae bacterium]
MEDNKHKIDLILLDIMMPVMDGKEFLQYKKNVTVFDEIPVIMITADDSAKQQVITFSLGANDYIVKPFIPEVVTRRVKNVLESNFRFKQMVKEYNTMSQQLKIDLMTGLLNRMSAEEMIIKSIQATHKVCAMIMIDIDNFKNINDTCGHDYGDKAICAVARKLSLMFRSRDIVARMGGDEFAVFISDLSSSEALIEKADEFCAALSNI